MVLFLKVLFSHREKGFELSAPMEVSRICLVKFFVEIVEISLKKINGRLHSERIIFLTNLQSRRYLRKLLLLVYHGFRSKTVYVTLAL